MVNVSISKPLVNVIIFKCSLVDQTITVFVCGFTLKVMNGSIMLC
jgi:hypothetical protein